MIRLVKLINKWKVWLLMGLVLSIGLVARLWLAAIANLDVDEAFTSYILRNHGFNWMALSKVDPSVPPLQYLWFGVVEKIWNNLLFLRIFNGILPWVGVFWIGGEICKNISKKDRAIYWILSAFSMYQVIFSWRAYVYGMMAFWTVLFWWLVQRYLFKESKWVLFWIGVVAFAGFVTHYMFIWAIIAFAIWSFIIGSRRFTQLSSALAVAIGVYIYSIRDILFKGASNFVVVSFDQFTLWNTLGYFFFGGWFELIYLWTYAPLLVFLIGGIFLIISKKEKQNKKVMLLLYLTVVSTIFFTYLTTLIPGVHHLYQIRTFVPASLAFLLLFSQFVGMFWENRSLIYKLCAVAMVALFLVSNIEVFFDTNTQLAEDFQAKNVANIIAGVCDGRVYVEYEPYWFGLTFNYYFDKVNTRGCIVDDYLKTDIKKPEQWWVIKSHYYGKELGEEVDGCPSVLNRWALQNEELFLCRNN